jgi:hypothetical protein
LSLVNAKRDLSEPAVFGVDEAAIDPATLIVLVELALKVIAFIRERRKS